MAVLRIPTPLRPYAQGNSEVNVQGQTVREALTGVTQQYTALQPHLFTANGELRAFVNLFLNEEDIRQLQINLQKMAAISIISGDKLNLFQEQLEGLNNAIYRFNSLSTGIITQFKQIGE